MLTDRRVADLLDRFPPPEEAGEGPPLTVVSTFGGIGSLELRGIAFAFDPETDVLSMTRAEWSYLLRAWTEHVLRRDLPLGMRERGTISIVDNLGP